MPRPLDRHERLTDAEGRGRVVGVGDDEVELGAAADPGRALLHALLVLSARREAARCNTSDIQRKLHHTTFPRGNF